MSYFEHQLIIRARNIIQECEEYQQSNESDFSKAEQQRFAYQELRKLLIGHHTKCERCPYWEIKTEEVCNHGGDGCEMD